jgi:putative membrane protein
MEPGEDQSATSARKRFPRALHEGNDPDPRFTLANERTFLAWIRTSLALLAGGIAVEAFTQEIFDETARKVLGTALLVLGGLLAASAAGRWLRVESAMRQKRSLPIPVWIPLIALICAVAAVTVLVAIWVTNGF